MTAFTTSELMLSHFTKVIAEHNFADDWKGTLWAGAIMDLWPGNWTYTDTLHATHAHILSFVPANDGYFRNPVENATVNAMLLANSYITVFNASNYIPHDIGTLQECDWFATGQKYVPSTVTFKWKPVEHLNPGQSRKLGLEIYGIFAESPFIDPKGTLTFMRVTPRIKNVNVGPDGLTWIFNFVDSMTKYKWSFKVTDSTTAISGFGFPLVLFTVNDDLPHFTEIDGTIIDDHTIVQTMNTVLKKISEALVSMHFDQEPVIDTIKDIDVRGWRVLQQLSHNPSISASITNDQAVTLRDLLLQIQTIATNDGKTTAEVVSSFGTMSDHRIINLEIAVTQLNEALSKIDTGNANSLRLVYGTGDLNNTPLF